MWSLPSHPSFTTTFLMASSNSLRRLVPSMLRSPDLACRSGASFPGAQSSETVGGSYGTLYASGGTG